MGKEGPLLALSRGPEQVRVPLVNSETFSTYLRPEAPTPPERDFAPYLNLSALTPSLKKMVIKLRQQNAANEPPQPQEMIGAYDDFAIRDRTNRFRHPSDSDEKLDMEDVNSILANSKLERLHVFYRDPEDDQPFHFSEGIEGRILEDGDHEVGLGEVYDLIDGGNEALATVHNHPEPAMLSAWDEAVFLQRMHEEIVEGMLTSPVYKSDARLVKASFVLNPGITTLAVATAETMPVMSDAALHEFIAKWDPRIRHAGNDDEAARLEEQRRITLQNSRVKWEAQMDEGTDRLQDLGGKLKEGSLTEGEKKLFFAEKDRLESLNAVKLLELPENQLARMNYLNYTGQATNGVFFELARAVKVKLYSSTNMRDFWAFSA